MHRNGGPAGAAQPECRDLNRDRRVTFARRRKAGQGVDCSSFSVSHPASCLWGWKLPSRLARWQGHRAPRNALPCLSFQTSLQRFGPGTQGDFSQGFPHRLLRYGTLGCNPKRGPLTGSASLPAASRTPSPPGGCSREQHFQGKASRTQARFPPLDLIPKRFAH